MPEDNAWKAWWRKQRERSEEEVEDLGLTEGALVDDDERS